MTGQVLFYREGRFYITKKREATELKIEADIEPEKLYQDILYTDPQFAITESRLS